MDPGLFALNCPDCGRDLPVDEHGTGACVSCGRAYLTRFGYLIPIDSSEPAAPIEGRS